MFQRSSERLYRLLSLLDDVLGDPIEEAAPHPHRRTLRWERERRPGSVAARPAHCISPVRASARASARDGAER
jgi:hypothetical protein